MGSLGQLLDRAHAARHHQPVEVDGKGFRQVHVDREEMPPGTLIPAVDEAVGARDHLGGGARLDQLLLRLGELDLVETIGKHHGNDTSGKRLIGHTSSEEHTSELQSLMRTSYATFRLKTKNNYQIRNITIT